MKVFLKWKRKKTFQEGISCFSVWRRPRPHALPERECCPSDRPRACTHARRRRRRRRPTSKCTIFMLCGNWQRTPSLPLWPQSYYSARRRYKMLALPSLPSLSRLLLLPSSPPSFLFLLFLCQRSIRSRQIFAGEIERMKEAQNCSPEPTAEHAEGKKAQLTSSLSLSFSLSF